MTASASQCLFIGPRWRHILRICPIWRALWTLHCDVSTARTYSRNMSISTSFLDACRRPAALCVQTEQAARRERTIWANPEDIGYGR